MFALLLAMELEAPYRGLQLPRLEQEGVSSDPRWLLTSVGAVEGDSP